MPKSNGPTRRQVERALEDIHLDGIGTGAACSLLKIKLSPLEYARFLADQKRGHKQDICDMLDRLFPRAPRKVKK